MAATLEYSFSVVNEHAIDRALAGIERRLSRHASFVARTLGGGAGMPRSASSAARMSGAQARQQSNALRGFEQIGRAARAADLKTAREQISNAKRVERERLAGIRRSVVAEAAERSRARNQARAEEKKAAARTERTRVQSEKRAAQAVARSRSRFADATSGKIGGAVGNALGGAGMLAGSALSIGGGFAVAGALHTQAREQAAASRLANQAGDPSLKKQLLTESRGVRGFTGEEALSGIEQFVTKTGDLKTARAIIGDLGDLALATGTDLGDLGATAGQAFNVLKDQIEDPVARMKELNAIMGVLAQQGSLGAVEIKDLARDFGKLGAATRGFEGGAPDLLRTMGAFAQIAVARGGAPSSAEAATGASRLVSDIVMHREKFKKLGVNVQSKKDKTKLAAPEQIMADVLEKTGGDVMKTSGLFGEVSGTIFKGMAATFSEAEKKKKGSGRAAALAEFERFAGAKLDPAEMKRRAASRLDDPDLRFKETLKEFNSKIGEQLLPTLTRLIPEFAKLLPYVERGAKLFGEFVKGFVDNPIAGIGKLIALKVAADLAGAGIGAAAGAALSKVIGGMSSMFAGGGAAAGGGKMAAAGMGLGIGLTAATVILTAGVVNFEKTEADLSAGGQRLQRVRDSQDINEVKAAVLEQRRAVQQVSKPGIVESVLGRGVAEATTARDPVAIKTQEAFLSEMEAKLSKLEAAGKDKKVEGGKELQDAANALKDAAGKLSGATPNRGNAPSPIKG